MKKLFLILLAIIFISPLNALSVKECKDAEQVVDHDFFILGYDEETECPLYVEYTLDKEETSKLGTVKRKDAFRADKDVITKSATPSDYTNSGFDRGHMFPSYHGTFCFEADNMSFVMSNMCPQYGAMNRGDWKEHEFYIIDIAKTYGDVERVCGPIFFKDKTPRYIGKNQVRVPDAFYSIISYVKDGKEVTECIIMTNENNKSNVKTSISTVEEISSLTGITFE